MTITLNGRGTQTSPKTINGGPLWVPPPESVANATRSAHHDKWLVCGRSGQSLTVDGVRMLARHRPVGSRAFTNDGH
jgi:hypothetical protein